MKLIRFKDNEDNLIFVSPEQVVYIKQLKDETNYVEIMFSTGDKIKVQGTLTKEASKLSILSSLEGIIRL